MNGGTGGTTVWKGTAFRDCGNNEITLIHNRFENGTSGDCNNGAITGWSMRVENSSYVSQLEVIVNSTMIGKGIACAHDNGSISTLISSRKLKCCTSVTSPSENFITWKGTYYTKAEE